MKPKTEAPYQSTCHNPAEAQAEPYRPNAVMIPCPGVVNDGLFAHSMRDGCSGCAPYWEQYPICPTHGGKLRESKRGFWCSYCRKYLAKPERGDLRAVGQSNLIDGGNNEG